MEWVIWVRERLLGIVDGDVILMYFVVDFDISVRLIVVKKVEVVSVGVSVVVIIGVLEVEGKFFSVDMFVVIGLRKRVIMGFEELRVWVGERVVVYE